MVQQLQHLSPNMSATWKESCTTVPHCIFIPSASYRSVFQHFCYLRFIVHAAFDPCQACFSVWSLRISWSSGCPILNSELFLVIPKQQQVRALKYRYLIALENVFSLTPSCLYTFILLALSPCQCKSVTSLSEVRTGHCLTCQCQLLTGPGSVGTILAP